MIARLILPLALLAALPAQAERALTTVDGRVFAEIAGPDGSRLESSGEVIRLGADCAAEIPGRGQGRWFWTGEGTTVELGTYAVRFDGVPLIPLVACVG